ncbi:hypothetical protein [Paenibacillus roseipurpureus]|uniref:Uncharacterized protein n=1 Tax=Paenibacillus roseopurpureus TaxID=2918901 RepID=A0AA96RPP1_9BACL|nr:hypothetical protein [Paenibacillus sp. MBLB1832]WNR46852.1 hypothetical protein MJB10_12415 [Paenibacillus sp. MBLB1832]
MNVPAELDGAKVIMYIENDKRPFLIMKFEEDDGSQKEVPITRMAIAKYENGKGYYLFLCDMNWEVQNDFDFDSIEEAIHCASKSFEVKINDWNNF